MFWKRAPVRQFVYLIFGLGNPGMQYVRTRHNAGWWIIDELGRRAGVNATQARLSGQADYCELAGRSAALIKPTTYMNRSGACVAKWRAAYPQARLIVVHDDISMAPGKLRLRAQGSSGGHRGIASVIQTLGSEEFDRLKLGVGLPPPGVDAADYVLVPPSAAEEDLLAEGIQRAVTVLEAWAEHGFERAQQLTGGG